MTWWSVERTKLAIDRADIGVVDVPVNQVGHFTLWVHGQAALMGRLHQVVEWGLIVQDDGLCG